MRISVVTAVFNRVSTIADTLRSVRSQEGADIEHIVIDGGSTDGTLDVVRSFPHQPDVLLSGPDRGIYDAMNKGLAASTGEYVGFLNADDYLASSTSLVGLLGEEAIRRTDCVFGDIELVSSKDSDVVVRRWRTGSFSPLKARLGWQAPHPAFYARRECFERWGGFDSSMRIAADYELALRFLLKHSATWAYRATCVARMRIGGRSTRSLSGIFEGNRECGKAWKQNGLRGGFLVPVLKPITKLVQLRLPRSRAGTASRA